MKPTAKIENFNMVEWRIDLFIVKKLLKLIYKFEQHSIVEGIKFDNNK